MKARPLIVVALLIQGCTGAAGHFYRDQTGGVDVTADPTIAVSYEKPELRHGNNPEEDALRMLEDGYAMIGYSSYNAANVDENAMLSQAKKVHAAVVLEYSQYTNTVSGSLPLTRPDNQTSYTSLYGSSYGSRGYATYSGTAQTTTYGTRTTYVPFSINRYDVLATYWVRLAPQPFGVHARELDPETRQKIGSNKGLIVIAVIKGSPAFRADVLPGDVLRGIGDTELYDINSMQEAASSYAGQKVRVDLLRNGTQISKEIRLGQRP